MSARCAAGRSRPPAPRAGVTVGRLALVGAAVVRAAARACWRRVVAAGQPHRDRQGPRAPRRRPSAEPFGMDDLGRSVLSRVVHAYRVSLGVALASVALALAGGRAARPGRRLRGGARRPAHHAPARRADGVPRDPPRDRADERVRHRRGAGVGRRWPSSTRRWWRGWRGPPCSRRRSRPTWTAPARSAPPCRAWCCGHILPNATTPVLVQASVLMAVAILVEAALSFLGVGVRPPIPSLGLMLADGRGFMLQAPVDGRVPRASPSWRPCSASTWWPTGSATGWTPSRAPRPLTSRGFGRVD